MNEMKLGAKKTPKKRKIASLDKRKARAGWLFVLPFLIGFICVYMPIMFQSIELAFSEVSISEMEGPRVEFPDPEGLFSNFMEAFTEDPAFVETLLSGLGQLVLEVPAILLFALFMAVLLNQKMAGRGAFRAIFFLPVVLSTGIMETIEMSNSLGASLGSDASIDDGSGGGSGGIVNALDFEEMFASMKVGTELVTYVVDLINDIYSIVNRSGVQMLIFLAGLQSISPAIYEACKIDGATGWETFWKITFPMISPMILVNAVYTIIDAFTTESNTVMSYIANKNVNDSTVASAMAWSYFLIVVAILAAVAGIMSMFVFYQRKD